MSLRSELLRTVTDCDLWNSGGGVSPQTRIEMLGNHVDFLSYSLILWPDFLEYDGCVFWRNQPMDARAVANYEACKTSYEGDRSKIEAMINHLHIAHLFSRPTESRDVVLAIGRLLKESWSAKLARELPFRSFVVSCPEDFADHLEQYEITFYENRQP